MACQPGKSKLLVKESNIVHGADDLLRKRVEFVVRIYCGEEFTMMGRRGGDVTTRGRIVDSLCAIRAKMCLNDL